MSVMGKLDDFIANIVYDLVPPWRKEMMRREWYRLIHGRVEKCDHEGITRGLSPGYWGSCPYCGKGFWGRERPLRRTFASYKSWIAVDSALISKRLQVASSTNATRCCAGNAADAPPSSGSPHTTAWHRFGWWRSVLPPRTALLKTSALAPT